VRGPHYHLEQDTSVGAVPVCPLCHRTEDMVPSPYAPSHWGGRVLVCDSPPCIYRRTQVKALAARRLAGRAVRVSGRHDIGPKVLATAKLLKTHHERERA
jgi:hypothetical protein